MNEQNNESENIIDAINSYSTFSGTDIGDIDQYFLPSIDFNNKRGGFGVIFLPETNQELDVILRPYNLNIIKYDFIKSYFDIKNAKIFIVNYNSVKYMMYRNYNDMKLSIYLKSMKFRKCDRFLDMFLHELRKNFAYMFLMGYNQISEDNIYVRYYTKEYKNPDGLDLIYPISINETNDFENGKKDFLNFSSYISKDLESVINKWFNIYYFRIKNVESSSIIIDDRNKNPMELFMIYCDSLIKELQYNFKIRQYTIENDELRYLENTFEIEKLQNLF